MLWSISRGAIRLKFREGQNGGSGKTIFFTLNCCFILFFHNLHRLHGFWLVRELDDLFLFKFTQFLKDPFVREQRFWCPFLLKHTFDGPLCSGTEIYKYNRCVKVFLWNLRGKCLFSPLFRLSLSRSQGSRPRPWRLGWRPKPRSQGSRSRPRLQSSIPRSRSRPQDSKLRPQGSNHCKVSDRYQDQNRKVQNQDKIFETKTKTRWLETKNKITMLKTRT